MDAPFFCAIAQLLSSRILRWPVAREQSSVFYVLDSWGQNGQQAKSIETAFGLLAMPCFAMRCSTQRRPLVPSRQLAGPLSHERRIHLRVAQPKATQVLVNRAEMDAKLIC
jgi:hypothetical protein